MNAQIGQTEKAQRPLIVYENVLLIRREKLKEIDWKTQEKVACKPASAVGRSRLDNACVCKIRYYNTLIKDMYISHPSYKYGIHFRNSLFAVRVSCWAYIHRLQVFQFS